MNYINKISYHKNHILLAACIVMVLCLMGGQAYAQSPYLSSFNSTYGTSGTVLNTCNLCHPNYPNSFARNGFGSDYASGGHLFNATLEGKDSDGDGFTNIQEINARTFPGDPNSKPATANQAPVLAAIGNKTVSEGSLLSFTATATDTDIPAQTLTFSLDSGAPAGAAITAGGAFTWTPTEAQGPGSFPITVRVTDNGTGSLFDTETIQVTVNEVNVAPVLAPIGNKSGTAGSPVTFTATATDADIPAQTRTFSLGAGAPTGATINSSTGAFSWTPSAAGSFPVTVTVTDNGTPPLNDTETITVTVNTPPPTGEISTMPGDGGMDVTVTTVVIVTGDGSVGISTVVNDNSFSLMESSPVAMTSTSVSNDGNTPCVSEGIVNGKITFNTSNTEATFTPLCKLANGTAYTATILPVSGLQQSVLAEPMRWSFTTIPQTPDTDGDGVEDGEDDHPQDNKMATPPSSKGKGKFLIDITGEASASLVNVEGISDTSTILNPNGRPVGFEFVDGMVNCTVEGVTPGGTITVKITFPSGVPKGSKVYKADGNGFLEFPGAVVNGSTVTMTLTDGGTGDADGQANGVIVDPVGVAVPTATGGGTIDLSTGVAGGGCSISGGKNGGWKETVGSYAILAFSLLGLVLRRRRMKTGK